MSLESLRKLRAQAVETLMMELGQITRTLTQSEERYHALEVQMQKDIESYGRQSASGLAIEAWLEWHARMDSQQAALGQARRAIEVALEAWQETKARLIEAGQERKLLDLIADKRREALRADAGRQEQRMTDEAASRGYLSGTDSHS
jgi:flagellar FliJ protein